MHNRETFQKIARSKVKEDKHKQSRRDFLLSLGGVAVVAGFGAIEFKLLKDYINQWRIEKQEPQGFIDKSNDFLTGLEKQIEIYKNSLAGIETRLSQMITEIPEFLSSLEDVGFFEERLLTITDTRQNNQNNFYELKMQIINMASDIDLLAQQNNIIQQHVFKEWRNGDFIERKTRIEAETKSLTEQFEKTDAKFEVYIESLQKKIQEAKSTSAK